MVAGRRRVVERGGRLVGGVAGSSVSGVVMVQSERQRALLKDVVILSARTLCLSYVKAVSERCKVEHLCFKQNTTR